MTVLSIRTEDTINVLNIAQRHGPRNIEDRTPTSCSNIKDAGIRNAVLYHVGNMNSNCE